MTKTSSTNSSRYLLPICYLGFVSLGLPDTVIGVAWPSVRDTFHLQQSHIAWIFFGSGCTYFLSSFFAGRLMKLLKVGMLLAVSSGLVALSGFNYAFATVWPWFALGALLHGLGSGAIDSGLNHYVASHFSARHMNWLHASYSLGAMLGPLIMTVCIAYPNGWRVGYLIVAGILLVLALFFFITKWQWEDKSTSVAKSSPAAVLDGSAGVANRELSEAVHEPVAFPHAATEISVRAESVGATGRRPRRKVPPILGHRILQLQMLIFFIYTGLEVAVGQWSFTILTESRRIDEELAGTWVTVYWGSILAGRIMFGFIVERIGIDVLLRLSLITALAGTGLFFWNPTTIADPFALALCGLGFAVIFPSLMTRTPQRLGHDLGAHAIGFQVGAAMIGAAALPSVCGFIAQHAGLYLVAPTLLACVLALFFVHELLLTISISGSRT